MSIYVKHEGDWVQAPEVFVRRLGRWVSMSHGYRRDNGVWTPVFDYDIVPPGNPVLGLSINHGQQRDGTYWKYLSVRTRLTDLQNVPDCDRIRVLVRRDAAPANQYAQGYYSEKSDPSFPKEDWSEFRFNSGPNDDDRPTTQEKIKQWPPGANHNTLITGGQWYYAGAWARDKRGNWGPGVITRVWVPKPARAEGSEGTIQRSARFIPTSFESKPAGAETPWDEFEVTAGFVSGTDKTEAWAFYANDVETIVGRLGRAVMTKAQVLVRRSSDAHGVAGPANVHLFTHGRNNRNGTEGKTNRGLLGTLLPGQSSWFTLPDAARDSFRSNAVKGLGFYSPDPASGLQEINKVKFENKNNHLRAAELYLEWDEIV